ncbi:hypothetical protein EW026_g640 [Hermanssonia centrifuga]|uniref:Uncharacterized protein n=1 Tax=Hermanssonia centrifuga TaxID=98765 RepID=A0A4S4KV84_9APHY|nr:hypothetical protein EW026_g640 [Hermanssonia centrifuga]
MPASVFSSLRAYAFSNQSITWALPIFILNMVPIGADIYNFSLDIPQSLVYFDFNLCVGDSLVPPEVELQRECIIRVVPIRFVSE